MSNAEYQHITVLLNEAVDALAVREDGIYVDGTFGRGGHSRLILSRLGSQGRLIVFDKDPQAIEAAQKLAEQDGRVTVVHDGFLSFQTTLDKLGIEEIDGALFDLGISSPQIDDGARGFSFRFDATLWICAWIRRGECPAAEWIATGIGTGFGTRLSRIMVKSGLVARLRAPLLRNGQKVRSIQPASWRSSWHKTSVLVSGGKTLRRAPSRQFASLLTASSKR